MEPFSILDDLLGSLSLAPAPSVATTTQPPPSVGRNRKRRRDDGDGDGGGDEDRLRGLQRERLSARMWAGKARARHRLAQAHQAQVLLEHVRQLKVDGALRAGTEVVVRNKRKRQRRCGGQDLRVVQRRRQTKGRGTYQTVGPRCRIEMAFSKEVRNKALGRMFQIGPKAVALNRIVVSEVFLLQQLAWMQCLVAACDKLAPEVVVTQRRWDETRHCVSLALDPREPPVRDDVEVMVSSLRLALAWKDRPLIVLDVVSPPCPLLSPSATNIYAALHGHPLLRDYVRMALQSRRSATLWRIHVNEFDGASGNDKLNAAQRHHPRFADDAGTLFEYLLCSNHQQHLVTLSVLSLLDMSVTNAILAAGVFLSSQGHWTRFLANVDRVVEKYLKVYYLPVDPHWSDYAVELCQFSLRN